MYVACMYDLGNSPRNKTRPNTTTIRIRDSISRTAISYSKYTITKYDKRYNHN